MSAAVTRTVDGVRAAADALLRAQATGVPCPPVRTLLPDAEVSTAYAVQGLLTADRLARGARVVGRKVGLTSPAVQAQLGVDSPDFGMLFADMLRAEDVPAPVAGLLQPRIEAEIAFVLAADLDTDTSPEAVRAATAHVVAALEIVDSRIAGWDITLVDTVADNASSAGYVLGATPVALAELDLRAVAMTMTRDGEVVSTGTGRDCLGDPVLAVSWLARTTAELGDPLRAGEVVLSGALGPMVAVAPGADFTAELSGLGSVHVSFEAAA